MASYINIILGASTNILDRSWWRPLHYAVSLNDDDLLKCIFSYHIKEKFDIFERKLPRLLTTLSEIPDGRFEILYEVICSVPLVSRLLPTDTVKIFKSGDSVRVDTTLIGMKKLRWLRGDVSLYFVGSSPLHHIKKTGELIFADHNQKRMASVVGEFKGLSEEDLNEGIETLTSNSMGTSNIWSRDVVFKPRNSLGSSWLSWGGSSSSATGIETVSGRPVQSYGW